MQDYKDEIICEQKDQIIALQQRVIQLQEQLLAKAQPLITEANPPLRVITGPNRATHPYKGLAYKMSVISCACITNNLEMRQRIAEEFDMAIEKGLLVYTTTHAACKARGIDYRALRLIKRNQGSEAFRYACYVMRGILYNPEMLDRLKTEYPL